ncbi:MAG: hypothetical protein ABSF13_04320 [Smithella sp.]
MNYHDEESYRFHNNDVADKCFCCNQNATRLLIVRHVESGKMVHLCPECMINYTDDYLLDNTRPWFGPKGNT